MRRASVLIATLVTFSLSSLVPTAAYGVVAAPEPQGQQQGQQQQGQQQEEPPRYEVVVVVTASRTEQLLLNAPTAVSVIGAAAIETTPAQNYADLLRSVPGLNVSQTSARDVNLSSRAATHTLATSQLVLIDGRTVYQDFFGFVLWDLMPVNFMELDQIEVVRGPGSAVWGANAMTGVVNIRTKSPRRLGNFTSIRVGGGERSTGFASFLHSGVRGPWAYKLSGSFFTQDPWPRPTTLPSGQPGNVFPNEGTEQPKFDARVDRELDSGGSLSFSGGVAATSGIIHTGIGPFDIDNGSRFGYVRGDYDRNMFQARFYSNLLSAESQNLLNGLIFDFSTQTYDVSAQNTSFFQDGRHIVTYGGNVRFQTFDLSIAPAGDDRKEGGAFAEDSITLNDYVIVNVGGRVDGFSSIDDPVFSPRISVLFRPLPAADDDHVLRASFSRAFRAPSVINNHLDTAIFNVINLGALVPIPGLGNFVFPSFAVGNPDLVEESLDQVEVGYRGVIADARVALDFAYYWARTRDNIDFYPAAFYSPVDPPPGWPLPNVLLALIPLPKTFSYRNIGEIDNQGIELGVRGRVYPRHEVYFNYSWQDEPDPVGIALEEINIPPAHRVNAGFTGYYSDLFYSLGVNYVDEAFWADVLDARFHGPTEAFTTLDASIGYRLPDLGLEFALRGTNWTDEQFQQHVFGDVIGRRVTGEVGYTFR